MITAGSYYSSFKARSLAEERLSLGEKYVILEGLYEHARSLGRFNERDIQLGLPDVVPLAASLNRDLVDEYRTLRKTPESPRP